MRGGERDAELEVLYTLLNSSLNVFGRQVCEKLLSESNA